VQRRDLGALLDMANHRAVDQRRLDDELAEVDDPVAD
jgi:hypothetical protein